MLAVIPLYRDAMRSLEPLAPGAPVWPRFADEAFKLHADYFEGLLQTYGADLFGPAGLPGVVEAQAPALRQALVPAPYYRMEERTAFLMGQVGALLPGPPPALYLGILFFTAPAATLCVQGRPVIALGMERFHPAPLVGRSKYWYHPDEVVEMIPHEAAHVARMQALGLPPTPQRLSLLEMAMLEGTALTFTDLLIGRESLATFLPPEQMAWHRSHDAQVRSVLLSQARSTGMEPFRRFFSADSPVSGYYAGYTLCREYLQRYGSKRIGELIALPSEEILHRLGL